MADESLTYPLRVAYDAHATLSKDGGLGKGVQLNNLLGAYRGVFVGLAPAGPSVGSNIIRSGLSKYLPWQQFSLPGLLREQGVQIFLAPYNTAPVYIPHGVQLVLVLHDLILMENFGAPTLYGQLFNLYRRFLIPVAVSRASTVLTVSEFSRREILKRFPSARVSVLSCSIAESWFVGGQVVPAEERGNYLLLVTGAPTHKNALRAFRAFAQYSLAAKEKTCRLHVVGMSKERNLFADTIKKLCVEELVVFEPFLSETDLQTLYRNAKAVLVPSLMEGFGIPVLEAMASGTPVVSSNAASLPEVGGDAARYFDPTDVQQMSDALIEVLSDGQLRAEMITKGMRQSQRFHPEVMKERVQAFWDGLAEAHANTR